MSAKKLFRLLAAAMFLSLCPLRVHGHAPTTVFQYAFFYDGLLEFTDCAPFTINGRVHCNSNIFVGCPSPGSTLTFNSFVTCSGIITNPSWFGYSQSSYIASNITYNGTPSPGWGTGVPAEALPFGAGSYREMINLPPPGNSGTNDPNFYVRYFNKADLVILVTNITTALDGNNVTNVVTSVIMKSSMLDTNPLIFSYTNNLPTNTPALYTNWLGMTTNWSWFGASNWLTTNSMLYDARQGRTNHITEIDVGKFGTWIATNTNCLAKWNFINPFDGVIYVANSCITNQMFMNAVRLTNGQTIPSVAASNILGSTNQAYNMRGLTVATINPLYISGLYNCPGPNNVGSTNTIGTQSCSVVCDALTLLSPAWTDTNSFRVASGAIFMPTAAPSNTVNTAIIAGNVPSTGSSATQYSGGVNNFTRLLEDWSSATLWVNTSFVNLYSSAQATAQFQSPGIYYNAPVRAFSYDLRFTSSTAQPPGTPILSRGIAEVTISNVNQVYDGTPKPVTVTTTPAGLPTLVYYDTNHSNTNAPIAPGNYPVLAAVDDVTLFYAGGATNLLVISKGAASITLSNLAQTYDGTAKSVSAATTPANLNVKITYNGFTNPPTNANHYTVIATIQDTNYAGGVTNTLVISPTSPTILLSNLSQAYDGTAKAVSYTTIPPGLTATLTYNGSPTAPTNSGSYTVVAVVNSANYSGAVTNTLVITPPAPTPISLTGLTSTVDGSFQLNFTNLPGLGFSVLSATDPSQPLTNWDFVGSVVEVAPGQYQFIDVDATNNPQQFYIIRSP